MQQKGQEELNQYAASLQKELATNGILWYNNKHNLLLLIITLPVAQDWNDS